MIVKFRRKQVFVGAMQWTGTAAAATPVIDWVLAGGGTARYHEPEPYGLWARPESIAVDMRTGGTMHASAGDWIVSVGGGYDVFSPDVFESLFEPVEETRTDG